MHTKIHAPDTDLEQLAHKRASAKMGWYIHASIYVVVNLVLAALSAMSGRHWAIYPALGWGLGLPRHRGVPANRRGRAARTHGATGAPAAGTERLVVTRAPRMGTP
jgi:hypothetical protein